MHKHHKPIEILDGLDGVPLREWQKKKQVKKFIRDRADANTKV